MRLRRVTRVGVLLDDFKEHAALVLEEPLGGGVDVVVATGVGTTDDHDRYAVTVVEAGIVNRGLEEMGVGCEPGGAGGGLLAWDSR